MVSPGPIEGGSANTRRVVTLNCAPDNALDVQPFSSTFEAFLSDSINLDIISGKSLSQFLSVKSEEGQRWCDRTLGSPCGSFGRVSALVHSHQQSIGLTALGEVGVKAVPIGHPSSRYPENALELTLVVNSTIKESKCELNMTKKYILASSATARRMLGRPPGSETPYSTLRRTITKNIMASKRGFVLSENFQRVGGKIHRRQGKVTYTLVLGEETGQIDTSGMLEGVYPAIPGLRKTRSARMTSITPTTRT